jgi:hypothetical protein
MVDSIIMTVEQKSDFKEELEHLQGHLPDWAAGVMRKTMEPSAKWIRMPVGIALMTGGTLGFLPILGFWMLPFGLALIARDVPFMRPPLARFRMDKPETRILARSTVYARYLISS